MKRRSLWSVFLLSLVLAACGPGEVVVTAEVEMMDPETGEQVTRPIENLEIQLLPFDRDVIFDSLTQAAPEPEPEFPEELMAARDSILQAQQRWREAESEWLAAREQLEEISDEMDQYSPAETRYRELFNQFTEVENRVEAAERTQEEAFSRYERLQQETFEQMEEARFEISTWEEEAFADYPEVIAARLQESGREILADTTDATGSVRFQADPGEWWIYARHRLTLEELYWNIRVDVERGDPLEIRLTRENAELRDVF